MTDSDLFNLARIVATLSATMVMAITFCRYVSAVQREQQAAREYYASRQRRRDQGLPND